MESDFKVIEGCPNYAVSREGIVKNINTNKIIKPRVSYMGYYTVGLYDNERNHKTKLVHRLVAETFIPNPENKPQVNHIDANKFNNHIDNLEWNTPSENTIHGYKLNLGNANIPAYVYDLEKKTKYKARSIKEVCNIVKVHKTTIYSLMKRSDKYPIHGRYTVKLVNESDLLDNSNTNKLGYKVYVYDLITKHADVYNSIDVACYYTGLKLTLAMISNKVLNGLGYVVSSEKLITTPEFNFTKEEILRNRELYFSSGNYSQVIKVAVKDGLNPEADYLDFESKQDFVDYLNKLYNMGITVNYIDGKHKITGRKHKLVLGYIVQFYGINKPVKEWGEYKLGEILNSRNNTPCFTPIYDLELDNETFRIFGNDELLEKLEPYILDKSVFSLPNYSFSVDRVFKALDYSRICNISITKINDTIIKI